MVPSMGRAALVEGGEFRRLGLVLVARLPFLVGHAVDLRPAVLLGKGTPRSSAASLSQFERQLRQKPARFIKSMFWTSVRSRRCSTSRRKAAASSSVLIARSISLIHLSSRAAQGLPVRDRCGFGALLPGSARRGFRSRANRAAHSCAPSSSAIRSCRISISAGARPRTVAWRSTVSPASAPS